MLTGGLDKVVMPSAMVTPYFLPDDVDFALLLQCAFENEKDDLSTASNTSSPLSSVLSSSEFGPVPTPEATFPIRFEDLSSTNNAKPSKALAASIVQKSNLQKSHLQKLHSKSQGKRNCWKKRAAARAKVTPENYATPPPKKPCIQRELVLDFNLDQLHALENGLSGYHAQYSNIKYTLEDVTGPEFNFTKVD
ncbi:hypothetical protein Moror_8575 [Moniliophthora roreri MCA 2997]|uniref:Uncharacterized protein n=1 Tax=Moniliophthora roreri (strain MCA 2997) TaxID=1381753 RepID=V2W6J7_MONRO|nr:hypothetical protein Moror_8575 [Moniliophthora roreri MCA 2997]